MASVQLYCTCTTCTTRIRARSVLHCQPTPISRCVSSLFLDCLSVLIGVHWCQWVPSTSHTCILITEEYYCRLGPARATHTALELVSIIYVSATTGRQSGPTGPPSPIGLTETLCGLSIEARGQWPIAFPLPRLQRCPSICLVADVHLIRVRDTTPNQLPTRHALLQRDPLCFSVALCSACPTISLALGCESLYSAAVSPIRYQLPVQLPN